MYSDEMGRQRIARILSIALAFTLALPGAIPTAQAIPTRSLTDRADDLTGPQIHLIYAIPSDAQDKNWDTNGQIKKWVDQGQDWLTSQVNRKLRYDTFKSDLDITFLKSTLTLSQMRSKVGYGLEYKDALLPALTKEFLKQSPQLDYKTNPKTYMFVVSESLSSEFCGYAYNFTAMGLAFTGGNCWNGPEDDSTSPYGIAWPGKTIIHESIHAFGVDHICDSTTDLMWGKPECEGQFSNAPMTLDVDRRDYFGGAKGGVDISQLPIWLDGSGSTQYSRVKATKTYTTYAGADFVYTIGDETSTISWDWERLDYVREGGLMECTLSNGKATITAKIIDSRCVFEIPLTWRGGVTATLTGKVWTGPYYGETTEQIKLWNPENEYRACTNTYCFAGETFEIESNYCYYQDSKTFTLQQYVDGQWKAIATTATRPKPNCAKTSWEPIPVKYTFDKAGTFTYRWVESNTANTRGFTEPVQVISILASNANYPVKIAKQELDKEAEAIAAEAAKKAEEERLARELYARQLDQCATSETNCYIGESFVVPSICFLDDVGNIRLEILNQNKWEVVTQGVVALGRSGCSSSNYGTPAHSMIFKEGGVKVLRWILPADSKFTYVSEPYGILIIDKSAGEPTSTDLAQAKSTAQALAKEADRLAAEAAAQAAAQAAAAAAAAEAAKNKKTTIICVKGKLTKKVTAVKPVCPKGYKKKKS